jgi:predicted transcriptional regulator of viral defense system
MTVREALWEVAVDQYGYVTSTDAAHVGVPVVELGKLAARGKLERVSYGVYRFGEWPVSGRDHLMETVLWARNPVAVLSHETALDVLDLCDVNPNKTHITVPERRKLRRIDMPTNVVVHYENLDATERGWWEQIPTVTAPTAIRQCIAGGLRPSLVGQAIENAMKRGLISNQAAESLYATLSERRGT